MKIKYICQALNLTPDEDCTLKVLRFNKRPELQILLGMFILICMAKIDIYAHLYSTVLLKRASLPCR